jgi:hypothetical protein
VDIFRKKMFRDKQCGEKKGNYQNPNGVTMTMTTFPKNNPTQEVVKRGLLIHGYL